MTDPTTPETSLPQPPRDPFAQTDAPVAFQMSPDPEVAQALDEIVEDAQEPSEPVQEASAPEVPENPKRIGLTISRELDKRVRVMEERQASFQELLRQLGVVDPTQQAAGLRGMYVEALSVSQEIDKKLVRLRVLTTEVNSTLEAL